MLSAEQSGIARELIRKNARVLRREPCNAVRLIRSLVNAWEVQVPERFIMPFGCSLRNAIAGAYLEEPALPLAAGLLFNKIRHWGFENLAALERFGAGIEDRYGAATETAVLAGDGAALAALYQDPGAFPGEDWEALLKNGTRANGSKSKKLEPPEDEWSETLRFGRAVWRKPKPVLLIALFAGKVGDPITPPNPPVWPHLGTALLVWRDRVEATEVLEVGRRLGQREDVERGLAIAAHIFPELQHWACIEKFGMPRWERKWAIPLAARRLVLENYG